MNLSKLLFLDESWSIIRKDFILKVAFLVFLAAPLSYFVKNTLPEIYAAFKIFKGALLAFAVIYLIFHRSIISVGSHENIRKAFVYLLLMLLTIPFSGAPGESIDRYINYSGGVLFLSLFIDYLFSKYDNIIILSIFCFFVFAIYIIPVITFYLNFNVVIALGFQIYGVKEIATATGFLSNNIGWASATVISVVLNLVVYSNVKRFSVRIFLFLLIVISIISLYLSDSRSGLVVVSCTILISLFDLNQFKVKKFLIFAILGIILVILVNFLYTLNENRILNNYVNETEIKDESRLVRLNEVQELFEKNSNLKFYGIGWGVFNSSLNSKIDSELEIDLHNSYLQLYYEVGLFPTIYFTMFYLLPFLYVFLLKFRSCFFVIVFSLFAYFENNLTSGQFFFFPFMFSLFLLSSSKIKSQKE